MKPKKQKENKEVTIDLFTKKDGQLYVYASFNIAGDADRYMYNIEGIRKKIIAEYLSNKTRKVLLDAIDNLHSPKKP